MSVASKLQLCNRALQQVGQKPLPDFTTPSKALTEINTCYDTLRRAELRRNLWRFSIRRCVSRAVDTDTRVITPYAWDTSTVYAAGMLVTYNGIAYISVIGSNTAANPETSDNWEVFYGPKAATPWDADISYFTGELVYAKGAEGYIWMALTNDSDYVLVPDAWDSVVTYAIGDRVMFDEAIYESFTASNLNNSPGSIPDQWDVAQAYDTPDQVTYLGNVYEANAPTTGSVPTGGGPWDFVATAKWDFVDTDYGDDWVEIGADAAAPFIPYSPGTGPASQLATKNLFFLPRGYLRDAPQDPKAGAISILGAPTNLAEDDWLMENGFIVSGDPGPIVLRFGADIQNVVQFDPMFFEGLAARIGFEVCEALTQSGSKKAICAQTYKLMMTEARIVNGIETSPEQPKLDDYLATRL